MEPKFKVGDRVIVNNTERGIIETRSQQFSTLNSHWDYIIRGDTGLINIVCESMLQLDSSGNSNLGFTYSSNPWVRSCETLTDIMYYDASNFKPTDNYKNNNKTKMQTENKTITQKFINLFRSEPYKTLNKVGLTNGDNQLTSDGQSIFLNWLLQKHAEEFKTEVADKLIETK